MYMCNRNLSNCFGTGIIHVHIDIEMVNMITIEIDKHVYENYIALS